MAGVGVEAGAGVEAETGAVAGAGITFSLRVIFLGIIPKYPLAPYSPSICLHQREADAVHCVGRLGGERGHQSPVNTGCYLYWTVSVTLTNRNFGPS